jgi:hypothetical protein
MKYLLLIAALVSTGALAQTTTTGSNASQSSSVTNVVSFPQGGPTTVTYDGGYTVKSAPTMYAPSLTASMTETCWGSVSAAVSVVGVGATGGMTIKDESCNRRLDAAVAWRMDRKDIAFEIMCQDDDFKRGAAKTATPCDGDTPVKVSSASMPPQEAANVVPVPGHPGALQYRIAQTK